MKILSALSRFVFALLFVVSLSCCAGNSNQRQQVEPVVEKAKIQTKIDSKSKFAKLAKGMSMKQVEDMIGPPTDTSEYVTGKAFIPFYFGNDTMRRVYLYKGEGQLIFVGGSGVSGGAALLDEINYDPNETGYNK